MFSPLKKKKKRYFSEVMEMLNKHMVILSQHIYVKSPCYDLNGKRTWRRIDTMYVYNWIALLCTWNQHNIVSQLCCCCLATKSCPALCNPMDCSPIRLPHPWDFPGKNTGVGGPFPSQGDLSNPGIEPASLAWQADSLPLSHQGSPHQLYYSVK